MNNSQKPYKIYIISPGNLGIEGLSSFSRFYKLVDVEIGILPMSA